MNITKQELHQIIKEELISVMYEITQPKDINWELISKNYLKALFHNDPDLKSCGEAHAGLSHKEWKAGSKNMLMPEELQELEEELDY